MLKRVPGTRDILPGQTELWQKIEEISREIFSIYNYREIRTPLIEEEALFNRSLGKSAEIVQKQMFLIKSDNDSYALRPEGTASIARAFIENNLDKTNPFLKLYYMGPMFRKERPQKGRFRQFHHIGCEVLGAEDADIDVEVISLAGRLLKAYSIDGYHMTINSLGCAHDKRELADILRKRIGPRLSEFCPDCQTRFNINVLRVIDCKNEGCKKLIQELDIHESCLCPGCKTHFNKVREGLDALKIDYKVSPHLVRGLDYYTRTVFEIIHKDLDSQQNAIGAGGRYDTLIRDLGGPDSGAIGFAFGVERLLLVAKSLPAKDGQKLVYLIALGEEAEKRSIKLLDRLRKENISSDSDYGAKSLKSAMRKANDAGARYVVIIGEDELKKDALTLKDMSSGLQEKIKADEIILRLRK